MITAIKQLSLSISFQRLYEFLLFQKEMQEQMQSAGKSGAANSAVIVKNIYVRLLRGD